MAVLVRPLTPRDIIDSDLCIGCGACALLSGTPGGMVFEPRGHLVPEAGIHLEAPSARFADVCPFSPSAPGEDELAAALFGETAPVHGAIGRFRSAHVGHVSETGFREQGSSGGMASWLVHELFRTGRIDGVAHVKACDNPSVEGRFFRYAISRSAEESRAGAKSRYYPIELSAVLSEIRSTPGRYAVVGLPCMIKTVQLLRLQDPVLHQRIVATIGLFCGHMKSALFVESAAAQLGVPLEEIAGIDFRSKIPGVKAADYHLALTRKGGAMVMRPWRELADGDWGAGFFMNPACNHCDDVTAETADASCGDAWVEPYASDPGGVNVVLARSAMLQELVTEGIRSGGLDLAAVDGEFVARTQAAGLRQRREGLAYRLTWSRAGLRPRKRVLPDRGGLAWRRRLLYRLRDGISRHSPRVLSGARRMRALWLYVGWATLMTALHRVVAYSRRPASAEAPPGWSA